MSLNSGRLLRNLALWISSLPLIWAIVVGALLRLTWIALCPNQPSSDQIIYHETAVRLAAGQGFVDAGGTPIAWWPVGYPAVLAFFYWVFAPKLWVAYLANAAIGTAAVGLAAAFAGRMFGTSTGRLAAWLVALYPTFVLYTTCLGSENVVFATLLALGYLAVSSMEARAGRALLFAAIAGLVVGLTAYARAPSVLWLIAFPALWVARRFSLGGALSLTGVATLVALLTLLPWGFRNQNAFDHFSLVSMNGASNLWMGNHPGSDGRYGPLPPHLETMSIPAREALLKREAVDHIVQNPGAYVARSLNRVWMTVRSDTIGAAWNETGIVARFGSSAIPAFKLVCTIAYYLLLFAAGAALIGRYRRALLGWQDVLLASLGLACAAPFILIVGGNRYHLPALPLLVVWAAFAIDSYARASERALPNSAKVAVRAGEPGV